jgi:hypothetical protein
MKNIHKIAIFSLTYNLIINILCINGAFVRVMSSYWAFIIVLTVFIKMYKIKRRVLNEQGRFSSKNG